MRLRNTPWGSTIRRTSTDAGSRGGCSELLVLIVASGEHLLLFIGAVVIVVVLQGVRGVTENVFLRCTEGQRRGCSGCVCQRMTRGETNSVRTTHPLCIPNCESSFDMLAG